MHNQCQEHIRVQHQLRRWQNQSTFIIIQKNGGKWNKRMRKFEVPLTQVPQLAKELQSIDRAYYIEQVPSIIADLINKYSSLGIKVKKQILIDANIVRRYSYI